MVDLHIEERDGGYSDRTGKKNERWCREFGLRPLACLPAVRYIGFLEKDLLEFPEDPRTLYYLGFAHFDFFNQNRGLDCGGLLGEAHATDFAEDAPTDEHWQALETAVHYYGRRINVTDGNDEERWFAHLKVALSSFAQVGVLKALSSAVCRNP